MPIILNRPNVQVTSVALVEQLEHDHMASIAVVEVGDVVQLVGQAKKYAQQRGYLDLAKVVQIDGDVSARKWTLNLFEQGQPENENVIESQIGVAMEQYTTSNTNDFKTLPYFADFKQGLLDIRTCKGIVNLMKQYEINRKYLAGTLSLVEPTIVSISVPYAHAQLSRTDACLIHMFRRPCTETSCSTAPPMRIYDMCCSTVMYASISTSSSSNTNGYQLLPTNHPIAYMMTMLFAYKLPMSVNFVRAIAWSKIHGWTEITQVFGDDPMQQKFKLQIDTSLSLDKVMENVSGLLVQGYQQFILEIPAEMLVCL